MKSEDDIRRQETPSNQGQLDYWRAWLGACVTIDAQEEALCAVKTLILGSAGCRLCMVGRVLLALCM